MVDDKKIDDMFDSEVTPTLTGSPPSKLKKLDYRKKSSTALSKFAKRTELNLVATATTRDSVTTLSGSTPSAAHEIKLTDEVTQDDELHTVPNTRDSRDGSSSGGVHSSVPTSESSMAPVSFDNYDAVMECQRLREKVGEPFCSADQIWAERRDLWTKKTIAQVDESNREMFNKIPEQYYHRIYQKLIMDDRPLKDPLNLEDIMKVINSGWKETKTWDNAARGKG
ncbi:Gag1p KNAG_0B06230 [Huiozyma naganishii CBS 8797]|uniref:Gag1-like clamp domain-containing protein n=1 Tax=Huiozyma naganishii (strain ATCC MYA-139 / BCRC 22969 / CBS 8797 / KCTC 17520 / NBRC 10181 / NCYC 3082 / Yp74L-3) TaxID=1071383 RepID=J7RHN2_HUIN7|nr:hypothetical protein KNAG_0B06230 [Kazachstania naganishii CBS 8797]CCK69053.1 hypothetical protein KNAG_0B06230 [Kazachstania naganishii CBS 8797]